MRLRLTVAYDGTQFSGWQSQPDGDTVQDALEGVFKKLTGTKTAVHGAGRTDAGVHALAQTAHADVARTDLSMEGWMRALNANLPPGVRVLGVRRTRSDFHARYDARGKIYRYAVWNGPVRPPLERDRAWHVIPKIDPVRLAQACELFVGRHDFFAFSVRRTKEPFDSFRTIHSIKTRHTGPRLTLTFTGDGFLYKMIRILSAAAVRCATGKADLEDLRKRLTDRQPVFHHVAPAEGLCLVRVLYR